MQGRSASREIIGCSRDIREILIMTTRVVVRHSHDDQRLQVVKYGMAT